MNKMIENIVEEFYHKALADEFLGYHFRAIEHFDNHLIRVQLFWIEQLTDQKSNLSFNLIKSHQALPIKSGELGRWLTLFKESINKSAPPQLQAKWFKKLDFFKMVFEKQLKT